MPKFITLISKRRRNKMKKKNLLTEAQITRFAAMAGIPALGRISEKVDIQAEETEETTTEETTNEATEETTTEETETEATNEEVVAEEEELELDAEAPAGEEVSQEKIESLVDAVLAAIESETGVPAQRVDDEAPAEEEPAEEPEADLGEEEPEEEMMEDVVPSLAERIAAAVQSILDEDSALEEAHCSEDEEELEEGTENEEELEEGYGKKDEDEEAMEESTEDQLEEITKAVVARLRSLK